jgi:YidC/Oxa1 family membrane protein insertase
MDFLYNNFISDLFTNIINGISGWGLTYPIAIILLTIMIRAVMLPLDTKQRANSRKMSALGPELQSIQKRYANDPQKMQKKQSELYHKMGVHPLMGCLPALIQLPIWFAFFGAMRVLMSEQTMSLILTASHLGVDSVSLPSFLWVHNFWQPDTGFASVLPNTGEFLSFIQSNAMNISPQLMSMLQQQDLVSFASNTLVINDAVYSDLSNGIIANEGLTGFANGWFILPALAGLSLFFQQKFGASEMAATGASGTQGQPGGKFMLYFFPAFSVYICITSPASFALYWTVSSAYAFGQARLVDTIQKKRVKKKEVIIQNK